MNKFFYLLSGLLLSCSAIAQSPVATFPPQPGKTPGQLIDEILKYVDTRYVDPVDDQKLADAAIVGMLEKLDPHTSYISKEEVADAKNSIEGSFVGVGIRFQILKDTLVVVETIPGGPSEKLGIRAGDKIVTIDNQNVAGTGLKNNDVREKLMGELGTKVNVDIKRRGQHKLAHYVITRNTIPVNTVLAAYMAAPGIGYIKFTQFSRNSHQEVVNAIKKLKGEGMESLVLDIQGNGGGLLNIAQYIADEFLSGNKLIVYSEGRAQPRQDLNAGTPGVWEKGKLVLLVDESSASASEILSGAVQDWDRGLIVGRRTFGKGLVQRPIDLSDGSQLRLTIARYYTPSGRWIQKPYDDIEAYRNDYMKRFMNGELTHADSIHLPDSLKYQTNITHRTVYGGGGIMPDVFVPWDTSNVTELYKKVVGSGAYSTFPLDYVQNHRESLNEKYPTKESFISSFQVDEKLMKEFLDFSKKEDSTIVIDQAQYKISKDVMTLRLKASIGQDMFGIETMYQIFNKENESLQKAIEILQKDQYDIVNLAKE